MKRELCVYDDTKINEVKTISNFPIYCGQTEKTCYETLDLTFGISDNGTIQLKTLVELEKLYAHSHNDAIGVTWMEHFLELSKFITPHIKNKTVLEFGGGTCKTFFLVADLVKRWTTLDFNLSHAPHEKLNCIVGSAESNFSAEEDVYFSSHFLEHLYQPYKFISKLSECRIGTKHIFSIPKQKEWMELGYANALFFEHSIILEKRKIIEEHKKYGYVLKDTKDYKGHSTFYCFERVDNELNHLKINSYDDNKKVLEKYLECLRGKHIIESDFYIFSAHIQSQYILNMNVFSKNCIGVLDNSPLKIGKKLYGFGLEILSPIEGKKEVKVLVPNSPYSKEIKEQLFSLGYQDVV